MSMMVAHQSLLAQAWVFLEMGRHSQDPHPPQAPTRLRLSAHKKEFPTLTNSLQCKQRIGLPLHLATPNLPCGLANRLTCGSGSHGIKHEPSLAQKKNQYSRKKGEPLEASLLASQRGGHGSSPLSLAFALHDIFAGLWGHVGVGLCIFVWVYALCASCVFWDPFSRS